MSLAAASTSLPCCSTLIPFRGHAHQHVAAGAEELQGRPLNLLLIQRLVHLVQAHRLLEPHLYGGATGEVQAPVQAAIEQDVEGEHRHQRREDHTQLGEAHEGDGFFKMQNLKHVSSLDRQLVDAPSAPGQVDDGAGYRDGGKHGGGQTDPERQGEAL